MSKKDTVVDLEQADLQFAGMKIVSEYLNGEVGAEKAMKRLKDAGMDVEKWASVLMGEAESHDELVRSTCPSAESLERILDED